MPYSPIHAAATNADVDALRRLLEEGVSPNLVDPARFTPLHLVCADSRGDVDDRIACLNLLVDAGGDINAESTKSTPLSFAAGYGHPKLVAAVISAGANVNWHDSTGWTPLTWACWRFSPSVECVELLLNAGAAVNARGFLDDRGTPLDYAIDKGNQRRIYPTLLRAGAILSRETAERKTSFFGEPSSYLRKVRATGGIKKYERAHLNAIAATFIPKLPLLPPEMVRRVVEYAFHVGDY